MWRACALTFSRARASLSRLSLSIFTEASSNPDPDNAALTSIAMFLPMSSRSFLRLPITFSIVCAFKLMERRTSGTRMVPSTLSAWISNDDSGAKRISFS